MRKQLWLLCFGGGTYVLLELLWNGHSHWTMFLLGGACFRMLGAIRKLSVALPLQCLLGGMVVTAAEFCAGILLNIILRWNIWDYSNLPFNVLGQICLPFTMIWTALSLPAIKIAQALDKQTTKWFPKRRYPSLFHPSRSRSRSIIK